jgi:hypothetical protein
VKPSPTITAYANPTVICEGQSIVLIASGAASYSWNAVSSSSTTTVAPATSTVYTATGAGTNLCQSSKIVSVTVFALPNLTVTPARATFCKGEKIKLTASGAVTYTWVSPALLNPSVQVNPTITTVYTVSGTNSDGCTNEKTFTLTVNPCTGIGEQSETAQLLIYPNPNNGSFIVKGGTNISLSLLNELGQTLRTFELDESNSYEVPVSELPGGIYFIVGQQDLRIKQKIVITK